MGSSVTTAHAQPQDSITLIAQINQARLDQEVFPFKLSPVLQDLAQNDADYLAALPHLPSDLLQGADGSTPVERAAALGWESYGNEPVLEEIVTFSESLPPLLPEDDTLLSPAYREIGIGMAAFADGSSLVVIIMGSQPNTIPIMLSSDKQSIYIANEVNETAAPLMGDIKQVRLFTAQGTPLTEMIPWAFILPAPELLEDVVQVWLDDGETQLIVRLDPQRDIALLPEDNTPPVVEAEVNLRSESTLVTSEPLSFPTAETAAPTTPTLRVIYNLQSLTLLNATASPIDITGIVLEGSGQQLAVDDWASVTPLFLNDIVQGSCLQVWSWSESFTLSSPPECSVRLSYIYLAPSKLFWNQGDFAVKRGETILAMCSQSDSLCDVVLR